MFNESRSYRIKYVVFLEFLIPICISLNRLVNIRVGPQPGCGDMYIVVIGSLVGIPNKFYTIRITVLFIIFYIHTQIG